IEMVAIGPHSPSLDGPAKAGGAGASASPDSGAKPIERVVGDGERLFIVLEFRHRKNGSENFFLEDAHLVVAFENRRLDIVSTRKLWPHIRARAAGQNLGPFLAADVEIGKNFFELIVRGLRADLGRRI